MQRWNQEGCNSDVVKAGEKSKRLKRTSMGTAATKGRPKDCEITTQYRDGNEMMKDTGKHERFMLCFLPEFHCQVLSGLPHS